MGLALSDTLTVLQLIKCHGIHGRHILQRRVSENDPRLKLKPFRKILAKVFQHGKQHRVPRSATISLCGRSSTQLLIIFIISPVGKSSVLHEHQRPWFLQELPALLRSIYESVLFYFLGQKMSYQALMNDRAPEFVGMSGTRTEKLKLVMLIRLDNGVGHSCKHICKMIYLEMLRKRFHQLKYKFHLFAPVEHLLRMYAIVTAMTIIGSVIFSEIVQKQLPATLTRLSVCSHLRKELFVDFLLADRLPLHEFLQLLYILIAVICLGFISRHSIFIVPNGIRIEVTLIISIFIRIR